MKMAVNFQGYNTWASTLVRIYPLIIQDMAGACTFYADYEFS